MGYSIVQVTEDLHIASIVYSCHSEELNLGVEGKTSPTSTFFCLIYCDKGGYSFVKFTWDLHLLPTTYLCLSMNATSSRAVEPC